jgi:hypothetical protein
MILHFSIFINNKQKGKVPNDEMFNDCPRFITLSLTYNFYVNIM